MAPMKVPIAPDRRMVRQYCVTSRMRGMTLSIFDETAFTAGPRMADQHLRHAEDADQHRQQPEPAGEVRVAEGEARIGVVGLLPDGGDEQAEEARDVALQRIAARQRSRR